MIPIPRADMQDISGAGRILVITRGGARTSSAISGMLRRICSHPHEVVSVDRIPSRMFASRFDVVVASGYRSAAESEALHSSVYSSICSRDRLSAICASISPGHAIVGNFRNAQPASMSRITWIDLPLLHTAFRKIGTPPVPTPP